MKKIFTITLFCLAFNAILSQELSEKFSTIPGFKTPNSTGAHHIFPQLSFRTVCTPSSSFEPLWVVDGIVYENYEIARKIIDLNNIEHITVLKGSSTLIQFSCKPIDGVIIFVTTKQNRIRKFIVKDFLDESFIAGATVTFMSKDKKDTLMKLTNDNGVIEMDKLKSGAEYELRISCVGYKTLSLSFKNTFNNIKKEILLERDIKECNEIVLTTVSGCHGSHRRFNNSQILGDCEVNIKKKIEEPEEKIKKLIFSIYPNPVQKNSFVTAEILANEEVVWLLRIVNASGNIVLAQRKNIYPGMNRFSFKTDILWASGMYIVELIDEKNVKSHQQKLVIQ